MVWCMWFRTNHISIPQPEHPIIRPRLFTVIPIPRDQPFWTIAQSNSDLAGCNFQIGNLKLNQADSKLWISQVLVDLVTTSLQPSRHLKLTTVGSVDEAAVAVTVETAQLDQGMATLEWLAPPPWPARPHPELTTAVTALEIVRLDWTLESLGCLATRECLQNNPANFAASNHVKFDHLHLDLQVLCFDCPDHAHQNQRAGQVLYQHRKQGLSQWAHGSLCRICCSSIRKQNLVPRAIVRCCLAWALEGTLATTTCGLVSLRVHRATSMGKSLSFVFWKNL